MKTTGHLAIALAVLATSNPFAVAKPTDTPPSSTFSALPPNVCTDGAIFQIEYSQAIAPRLAEIQFVLILKRRGQNEKLSLTQRRSEWPRQGKQPSPPQNLFFCENDRHEDSYELELRMIVLAENGHGKNKIVATGVLILPHDPGQISAGIITMIPPH